MRNVVQEAERSIGEQRATIGELAAVASKHPYYKYNTMWSRDVQDTVQPELPTILLTSLIRLGRSDPLHQLAGWLIKHPHWLVRAQGPWPSLTH